MLVPLWNKVAILGPATLLKKRLRHMCLPVSFVEFLRTLFYKAPPDSWSILKLASGKDTIENTLKMCTKKTMYKLNVNVTVKNKTYQPSCKLATFSLFYFFEPHPMDTSSSICHRFDVKIPRGKFHEISSILNGVEISTWIRLSKSAKYRWVLHVDFSMSFRCRIDVIVLLAVSFLSFLNIFCSGNLF